jgi:hypothetical protein
MDCHHQINKILKNSTLNPKLRIIWLTCSAKTIRWWTGGTKRYIWPLPLSR